MLLHTMIKNFMEVQINMSNAFGIILFYEVMGWFDCQDIGVEQKRPRFNPLYQHNTTCGICIFVCIPCTICVNV
jgi:hypothetical protein